MTGIRITLGKIIVTATLNESRTAGLVAERLPFDAKARCWGSEVYFETPVEAEEEDAVPDVPSGTVAFWPPGNCLCLFFGQRPASPVNVVGTIDGDPNVLARVRDGDTVAVARADE